MGLFENDYSLAWSIYLLGALGCWLVWWRMTRWMWRYLREPLQVLMAVLLFSPTVVDPERDLYAPAVSISCLDLAFGTGDNVLRAAADLSMYALLALIVYLLLVALRWGLRYWLGQSAAQAAEAAEEDPRTLGERLRDGDESLLSGQFAARTEPRL